MSGEIPIRLVDAFTTAPMSGNQAGVVTRGGEKLTEAQMMAIAREMNVSETAFLLPASHPGADLRIRWFTPTVEVPLCGHATVASFHCAAEEGSWGLGAPGVHRLRLETLSGVLPIEVTKRVGEPSVVRMGLPDPVVEGWLDPSPAVRALGLDAADLAAGLPAIRCGFYALLPLAGLESMRSIRPNMPAIREVTASLGGDGLIVAGLETFDPGSAVHVRMFAPGAGVDEDPVTGSAEGPVAGWLARIGYFAEPGSDPARGRARRLPGGRFAYTAEQGDLIGRRGRIDVELSVVNEGDRALARGVSILGRAVTVMRGTIVVP